MIHLDLRTDLAKVTPTTVGPPGGCTYTSPCAVGAMMTPEERQSLADADENSSTIEAIATGRFRSKKMVEIPVDQIEDFQRLQKAFDRDRDFWTVVEQLKEKYNA